MMVVEVKIMERSARLTVVVGFLPDPIVTECVRSFLARTMLLNFQAHSRFPDVSLDVLPLAICNDSR